MRVPVPTALLVAAAVAAPIPLAHSADVQVVGTVAPGVLSIGKIPHRLAVPKLVPDHLGRRRAVVRLPITVTDARGTGAGWALTLSARLRTAKGRHVRGAVTSLWGMTSRCTSCTQPRSRVVMPLMLTERHGIRAFVAARGSGMGRIALVATIAVAVPKRAAAGGYVLLPTLTRVSGP